MKRRDFVSQLALGGLALGFGDWAESRNSKDIDELELGIIGLSPHSAAFSKILNDKEKKSDLLGCRIKVLYHPPGNPDVEFSDNRLNSYESDVRSAGVKLVDSTDELINQVDGVLIETNDGRPHLEQVMPVFKAGKPVFVDKPVAASLNGVVEIFEKAKEYNVPFFSSSSLRYTSTVQEIDKKKVLGANTFSPASIEKSHTDLFWYGIHGVEPLYTVMGTGCKEVAQIHHSDSEDIVVGHWKGNRVGIVRGQRAGKHDYGGTVFGEDFTTYIGNFEGYRPLVVKIVEFFNTNEPPVSNEETIEIYAFMEAAQESKRMNGQPVSVQRILDKAYNNY
ncbi:MAG: Gfo/Idh/MocA family oxidoreductase [Cyclobacteriaceae bacterium]